jgi:hypothetical protein
LYIAASIETSPRNSRVAVLNTNAIHELPHPADILRIDRRRRSAVLELFEERSDFGVSHRFVPRILALTL